VRSITSDFSYCFLLLFELDPILIFFLLSIFMVFSDDLELIKEDMVSVEAIFVNQQQSIILNDGKNTS
jgi:hypothetical protein